MFIQASCSRPHLPFVLIYFPSTYSAKAFLQFEFRFSGGDDLFKSVEAETSISRRQTKLKLVHRNTFILLISLATGRKGTLLPFEDHTSTIQKAERSNPPPKQNY